MIYAYRGKNTKRIYSFSTSQADPETVVTINGEPCVRVNRDGSIMRGTAGAVPAGASPYATYASNSQWEKF